MHCFTETYINHKSIFTKMNSIITTPIIASSTNQFNQIANIEETYRKITECIFFKFCNPPSYTLLYLMSEQIQCAKRYTGGLKSESVWDNLKPATVLKFPIVHEDRQVQNYLNPEIFYTDREQHKYEYCSYTITISDTINAEYKNTGSNNVYKNIGSVFGKTTKTAESDFEGLGFEFARGYVFQAQNVYPIFSSIDDNKTYIWTSPSSQYDKKRICYHNVNYLNNDFTQSLDNDTNMIIELNKGLRRDYDCTYWDKDEKCRIHSKQLTLNEKRFIDIYYDSDYNYDEDSD